MTKFKISIVLSCLLINVSSYGEFGPQPRIIFISGHLIFNSAENKDIHFVTKGTGKIKLNDGDLSDAASLARNATETLNKINTEYYDTVVQVQRLKRSIEGNRGVLMRITNLENGYHNTNDSTGTDQQTEYVSSVLNRRIRALERKVNRLMLLLRKNECDENPCQNGGTCQDMFNGYLCRCPTEWEGANCDRDVNECARFAGTDLGCQNGATCVNKPGTYECTCTSGWFGIHCTQQSASCSNGAAEELCGHGYCIPQGHSYTCICHQGWTKEGTNPACNKDVDECALTTRPACSIDPPVSCINVPGSFYCGNCPAGYSGIGHCTDINECEVLNGGCSVNPMVQCINTRGSRVCGSCPPGYVGDGTSCTFRGVCTVNNGGCSPFAECHDNPRISATYVECTCSRGLFGSGIGPSGCTRSHNGNPCDANPCLHGTCETTIFSGTYRCHCNQRFTGTNCDIRKDPCQPNPCLNNGSCSGISGLSYTCTCASGYTGSNCETVRQACGGHLRELAGVLKYPSTSSIINSGRTNCVWIIQTNNTKVLNITFTEFHLEDTPNCQSDWLEIHDGRNSAANSVGRFCGNNFPNGGTLTSTHNAFYIWIRTQSATRHDGFSLNWTTVDPVCGGNLQFESHGILTSPGFPGKYPVNRDCYWYLNAPYGKRLQLHFFTLEIGSSANCTSDFVKVYEGETTSQLLAQFCNTSQPEPLATSGPNAVIYFHSDSTETFSGFQIAYSAVEGIPGCGGLYTGNTGSLSSPVINGEYLPNLNCEYKISTLENSRIKITFESFDVESESSCYYDSVQIYEGATTQSPLVGRYCGTNLPGSYISVGNHILVVFETDWGNSGGGFRLRYETICGGIYSEPSGVITSPGYPEWYKEDQICIYEIVQPLGKSITLEFFVFEMESSYFDDCMFDFVEIHDGESENSTLLGKYCDEKPPLIQSTYNILLIKFESDSSNGRRGFTANYTTTDMGCGGILRNTTGTFESPREGDSYPLNSNCTWIIVAPPGYIIELSWSSFELESTTNCLYDYVKIFGNNSNEEVTKYCGSTLPPTLTSTSNILTVRFITDTSVSYGGFVANYVFSDEHSVCGGRFFGNSGEIKSPSFPSEYPEDRECTWVIGTRTGQQIMLRVLNFTLENSTECRYDYLEIRNGASQSSPLIGKYCGNTIPKEIPSHTNYLYLFFRSDISISEPGFRISWDSAATGCGGVLTSPSGTLASPNYPEEYSASTQCNWRIAANAGSRIRLNITDIDLEPQWICSIDYIQIFDGPNEQSPSLGKFCNEDEPKPNLTSSSNHLTIKFISDASVQRRGFLLDYTTVCQNVIQGFRGAIESPNYPNNPGEQDCDWRIKVPMGNKINLTFTGFDITNSDNPSEDTCLPDYLKIKHGRSENHEMTTFGTYCDSKRPSLLTVNSNIAEILYKSSEYQEGSGFRFEWQIEGCGGVLTRPNGIIKTPNYPNGYPESTQCDWIIRSDYGLSIEFTFTDVDIEKSYDCNFDYVMITNGPNESYPLLSKLCSKSSKPVVVTSSGNEVFVRFRSDQSYKGKGFIANYTSLPTKCGGKLSGYSGSFTSPNYPKNYDRNDRCEWLIEVDEGHVIDLVFNDSDIANGCSANYVAVYDGPSSDSLLLDKICGTADRNKTIKSSSNSVLVIMSTSEYYTSKGFSATYYTACGGFITTNDTGIIRSTNSFGDAREISICSWYIVASDPSLHIWLTISHIHMTGYDESIDIYNGDSKEAPLALTITNDKLPPPLTSAGNALHIQLSGSSIDFIATYSVLDTLCGGELSKANGYFATPSYPNPYPIDIQCEWTIKVAPGNKISLSFSNFELVSSENCHTDYLEIRENNGTGKLLGLFCDSMPTNITQVGSLWLLFQSSKIPGDDSGATAKGFLAEYALDHTIELTGAQGQIASPLYPDVYLTKSKTFTWLVTAKFGKVISITFKDFNIEMDYDSACYFSYLEIFDGSDNKAPKLRELCGVALPTPTKTTSNVVFIRMSYQSIRQGSTFLLEWSEIDYDSKGPVVQKPKGCGSNGTISLFNSTSYNLTSPGYPYGYAEHLDCEWIFSTTPEFHYSLTFVKIDLENIIDDCIMDTVQIYSGIDGTENWDLVKTVCSPNSTLYRKEIETTNFMKVIFHTDSYSNGTGFNALIRRGCGGSLHGLSNGVIRATASDLSFYPFCQWNVTVRPGRTIKVKFETLSLSNEIKDSPCYNYVLLKNGLDPHSPNLGIGKYCNDTIPEPLVTTGNYLYILYTGSSVTNFSLTFEEISQDCGETITLSAFHNATLITSPNYPNIPPPFSECIWTIVAPPGESLRLDFEDRFDVTNSKNCLQAGVEIRDGGSKYSSILQTYCTSSPNSTFSTDNMMTIRFYTNVADPKNGFKAVITIASCGGTIRSNYAELHSPNFNIKSKFPKNSDCGWNLIGPPNHYLIINFHALDLGYYCDEDYVSIQEIFKMNGTVNNVGKYCGSTLPGEIRIASNEAFVRFVSGNNLMDAVGFSLSFNASQDECGGKLNMESGFIQSPGYPEFIINQRECEWTIKVPEGRRVTLEIVDLDMVKEYGDGLYISNDLTYNSFLAYLPDDNHTSVVKSSNNIMQLWFWSLHTTSHRGFRAHYTSDEPTICQGNFNQSNGIINSINETDYVCYWKHYQNINENVTLSMVISLSYQTQSCSTPAKTLVISADYPIARFCETLPHPVTVRSPYVFTQITVTKTDSENSLHYSVNFTTNPCGGIIRNEEGDVTSPGFPNKYSGTIECAWLLKLPSDQRIKVNFTTVNLDNNCDYNYISIYNGEFRTKPKIGQYCQNNKPGVISSQSNLLLIEYHADEKSNGTGFKFHYEPIMGGCSGIFHDESRIIETPDYPINYPNNSECNWEVRVSDGNHLVFEFIDRFYIEESENCKNDFVELWDYVDDEYKSAGKFCGRNVPQKFNSTSNRMKILFRSNENIRATGFKAKWTANCGGNFEAKQKSQYIVSPGYPDAYSNDLLCSYNITSPGNYINLVFEDFSLELDPLCAYDNVTLTKSSFNEDVYSYDYVYVQPQSLARPYCGQNKPAPLHVREGVTIKFATDSWVVRRGFKFSYSIETCGGLITEPSEIASPISEINGVRGYSNFLKCFWNITAPESKNVVVRFTQINLEYHENCYLDFVGVYDGTSFNESTRLAKLCGNFSSNLPVITSKSNSMILYMASDHSISYDGFKAEVYFTYGPTVGCGGTIIVNDSATIEAPVGLSHLDCHWEITTEQDNILKFHFNELSLVPCTENRTTTFGKQTCNCRTLEIRDGGASVSELITRLCDNNLPPDVTTSSHSAWMRLKTYELSTTKYFKVTVQKIPTVCGPTSLNVTNETQILTSPLYPNSYPDNIRCNWILRSEGYSDLFDLHFTDFDLVNVTNQEFLREICTGDRVEISDQNQKMISEGLGTATVFASSLRPEVYTTSQVPVGIHPFCGRHEQAFDYYSGQNNAVVSFISGTGRSHGKGFRLEYRLAGCNRNYTSVQGRIKNSNYIGNCDILINIPGNATITLYFMNFMVFDTPECSNSGMQIYDGDSKSDTLMATFCGYETPNSIYSKSNKLFIHLYNNAAFSSASYDILYTSTNEGKGCGGIFYNYVGRFTSPLYPAAYRETKTCTWDIIVPQGMHVLLKFSVFDVGGTCTQNFVDVKTFHQDNSDSMTHHFCSSDIPAVLRSENNHMSLSYTTTVNNGGSGWVAHFVAANSDTDVKWDY